MAETFFGKVKLRQKLTLQLKTSKCICLNLKTNKQTKNTSWGFVWVHNYKITFFCSLSKQDFANVLLVFQIETETLDSPELNNEWHLMLTARIV